VASQYLNIYRNLRCCPTSNQTASAFKPDDIVPIVPLSSVVCRGSFMPGRNPFFKKVTYPAKIKISDDHFLVMYTKNTIHFFQGPFGCPGSQNASDDLFLLIYTQRENFRGLSDAPTGWMPEAPFAPPLHATGCHQPTDITPTLLSGIKPITYRSWGHSRF